MAFIVFRVQRQRVPYHNIQLFQLRLSRRKGKRSNMSAKCLFIYLFNFANYIHIHTRITYNGQMAGNTLQLTPITAAFNRERLVLFPNTLLFIGFPLSLKLDLAFL